jgi:MFS family permease
MFVSGMGFFTEAYDLFVIGIVVSLLKTQWVMSTNQVSWLNSATLLASAVGAIVFGRVADMLGRKRIYGYEVLILAAGALASAFSPNYTFLLICRIILGIGIGGDYPVSATIMSEYSGKQSRGRMVGLVFAMQGAGLLVGPLLASILLASGLSNNITWRLLLGLGTIPGLAVFYLRRQIHETPRFAMAGGAADEAQAAIAAATGGSGVGDGEHSSGIQGPAFAGRGRRLLQAVPQPAPGDLAPRHRGRLDAARLLLLRQYDFRAGDPQADQPARQPAGEHADPARDLRGVRGAGVHSSDPAA